MMKKLWIKLSAVVLAAMLCVPLTACSVTPDEFAEKIDSTRTQLFVYNFNGGFGSDWIAAVKRDYEELHKDDVYEEGKKGVQIFVNPQKSDISTISGSVLVNRDEIYFTEYAYYHTLRAQGIMGDITQAVTTDIGYNDPAGTTIESKLSAEQKAYYGMQESDGTHYYAIPHYSGYSGLIYNVDLFDEKGFYFIDEPTGTALEDYFIYNADDKKSAGPDGEYDTADDGLPATYDEFFMLLEYIHGGGVTPITWNGANARHYLNHFLQALVADYEGLDQMMLNYSLDGTQATDLGKISGGQFVLDETPTAITPTNGYETARQAGKYYAIKFLQKLVTNDNYHHNLAFNGGYSHMDAQNDFLYGGLDGGYTNPIAMLCDGIWWESEATQTFANMALDNADHAKDKRNFAFLPLPKAAGKENTETTLYDHIYSLCFMKANIADWKKPLAYDFIKFVNSRDNLVKFTQITNTPKALAYEMTAAEKAKLTNFGRSVVEMKDNAKIVYPYSTNTTYVNNQASFVTHSSYFSSTSVGERQWVGNTLYKDGVTAENYFSGMYTYRKNNWFN